MRNEVTKLTVLVMAALGLLLPACSSDDDDSAAPTDGGATGTLKAPILREVTPMSGALHLAWTNAQPDCDTVEGERMMMMGAQSGSYESAFSVPGSVDNKMDTSATEDMTYMFRLRCKKGSNASPYSNEMSGNPHMTDMTDAGNDGASMMMDGGND